MTATSLAARPGNSAADLLAELFRRQPLYAAAALCLAALLLPTALALALDARTLLDANVWIKPLKFIVSLMVYFATLAWFAAWLPEHVRDARWHRAYAVVVVLCLIAEMVWIQGAATFAVASHFNVDSAFMVGIYRTMGLVAVLLTSATLVYGIMILRDPRSPLDPAFRLSVGIGLIATFFLTVGFAGYMAMSGSRSIGDGDLRVAHFFATHAMQVVPAFGLLAAQSLPARTAHVAVLGFSLLYVGFAVFTLAEALMGQPFLGGIL